ncbi:SDR family oxidoreductase [Sphingobacterium paludis]|uniref:NAD(P)-dependent dehydrogenase (Short-subunit alcohol dehydrogenase family) n=1 Tax=Sphingobacterium paludis TaxID=1476465 RepID=A0A4V3E1G0_9SPHI|nr:SDR family oxidoreductase [Sphingobacterium paludis]TDS13208.1 NAD(P)-dependent dehydrogenase (short-subunit alcohol dehydrogenase family) [Sphingobacterium paludis]
MNQTFYGKVAVVTGGTKGIGKAIAEKLSSQGAQVIVTARNRPTDLPTRQYFIATDATAPGSGELIAGEVLAKYGKIDIVVNNAGANLNPVGYAALTDESWDNELQLNLMAAVRLNKAVLPSMIESKNGVIINLSSGAAKQSFPNMTMAYSSAKAALNAYSKALANEVGLHNIRVNVVAPGMVRTPLMAEFLENMAAQHQLSYEEMLQSVIKQVGGLPLDRMGEPEEVANIVAFLASEEAKYITGSIYSIDGGGMPTVG